MHRCRKCHAAAQRERRLENPDLVRLWEKRTRLRRRDKIREYDRLRSVRDREKKRALQKKWRTENPERQRQKAIEYAAKRRALLKGAVGSFSADDFAAMIKAQKGKCWWCNIHISGTPEADHRIPLSRGGTNDRNNLVVSCGTCNRAKSNKMPWEFSGRLF